MMETIVKRFSSRDRELILSKSQQCIWTNEGTKGRDYLIGSRCLSEEIIKKFGLGYIPDRVDHQLSGRIIFPIYDPSLNLIALSSRRVEENNDFLPVYWHEAYNKTFYLYGIEHAKYWMRKWGFAVISEGQFDVLQMHNHGIKNAVGLSSTNLSMIQLSVIYRYCEKIILLFDEDSNESGQKAVKKIMRSMDHILKENEEEGRKEYANRIIAVSLGENSDPDSYLRKYGGKPLKDKIKEALRKI